MSGCYQGLQTRIKEISPTADYVPCSGHSLQLVGTGAADSSPESVEFFLLEQNVYVFFSASTERWAVLIRHLPEDAYTVKALSDTRWSARSDASKAIFKSYREIISALTEIGENPDQPSTARVEANSIAKQLQKLETAILLLFWNKVLDKFHRYSKKLQTEGLDLQSVLNLYVSLKAFGTSLRNENEFSKIEKEAKQLCGSNEYKKDQSRSTKPKLPFGESTKNHTEFSGRESFIFNVYYAALDKICTSLSDKIKIYSDLNEDFGFLWNLLNLHKSDISKHAKKLQEKYSDDLDKTFPEECVCFAFFLEEYKEMDPNAVKDFGNPQALLKFLKSNRIEDYPNVNISLRIFLCMAVTNCTGERSFSVLKRVKNHLQTTKKQDFLNSSALLYIENELLQTLDFSGIISDFAAAKARRKTFV
nr:PREDICTED: uncharacterized protein LOC109039167 [Bemisia tabaci]